MDKEYTLVKDFDFQLISDFYKLMNRQGPGSEDVTRKALSFIANVPDNAKIADLGCGTGTQTITLAENTEGSITAIDLLPDFIKVLDARIRQQNYADRITTTVCSMDNLPFGENELDLIWAEGSIYNIGFEFGLNVWHKYLKKNGYIAVSEVSWLTNARPIEIQRFWDENYPEIDSIANKMVQMQNAGYTPVATFVLPECCWIDNFYNPMLAIEDEFLSQHGYSDTAQRFVAREKQERDLYMKYKEYYSYVFYIGQKK